MGAYILRRLLLVIPTLLGIMIINFALIQFVPGGPVEQIIARIEGGGDVFEQIAGGASELARDTESDSYAGRTGLPQDFIDELQVEFKFARIVCEAGFTGEPDLRAEECAAVPIPLFERFVLMMWDYIRFDFPRGRELLSVHRRWSRWCRDESPVLDIFAPGCGRR